MRRINCTRRCKIHGDNIVKTDYVAGVWNLRSTICYTYSGPMPAQNHYSIKAWETPLISYVCMCVCGFCVDCLVKAVIAEHLKSCVCWPNFSSGTYQLHSLFSPQLKSVWCHSILWSCPSLFLGKKFSWVQFCVVCLCFALTLFLTHTWPTQISKASVLRNTAPMYSLCTVFYVSMVGIYSLSI